MSTKETRKNAGFEFCNSVMDKCFNVGPKEGSGEEISFKSCGKMMKQFCSAKEGKFDFEAFWGKMAKCSKGPNKEAEDKGNN